MFALFLLLLRSASGERRESPKPTGAVNCPGAFLVDGLSVPETATVFENSRVETAAGVCTFRKAGGGSLRMHPGSGIVLTAGGVQLLRGTVETMGDVSLTIAGAKSAIVPATAGATVWAQLKDSQLLVNVSSASAVLTGRGSEIYARLDAGTLMRAVAAPLEPSGLLLWMRGCLAQERTRRFIADRYTKRKVELLNDSIQKDGEAIAIWGSPQPIAQGDDTVALRLSAFSEKRSAQGCRGFSPVHLNNDRAEQPGATPQTLIDMATIPGQSGKLVNLP